MSGGQYTKQLCVKSSGLYSENGAIPELIFLQKFMWSCTLLKVMHPFSYEITESIEVPESMQHRMGLLWGSANGELPTCMQKCAALAAYIKCTGNSECAACDLLCMGVCHGEIPRLHHIRCRFEAGVVRTTELQLC